MGTCYSSNKLEPTNSSLKRPYDKSLKQIKTKSIQSETKRSHQLKTPSLITPTYLATISNQLIQINNQTNELKPGNSINEISLNLSRSTNQLIKMYENKSKLMSKLPKFNNTKHQVHDSSQRPISHFGVKQTLNADLIRLKNGNQQINSSKQTKSSNSSLTNSETSCNSSLSTNSTASYSTNNNGKINRHRRQTFTKATSSSTLNEKRKESSSSSSNKVISKQPTAIKSSSSLNQYSLSNHRLNCTKLQQPECSINQFNQALTKLPTTSKFTTTLTNLPKPQIAQRVTTIQRPVLPNLNSNLNSQLNNNLDSQIKSTTTLRPYSLKNATTNDNHLHKKPYTRTTSHETNKLGNNNNNVNLRYPYSETNLKSKITINNVDGDRSLYFKSSSSQIQQPNSSGIRKLNSNSSLPVPNNFKSSKTELRNLNTTNRQSNDLNQLNQLNNYSNNNQNIKLSNEITTTRSLTLDKDENLSSEKENKKLSTSFESPSFFNNGKELSSAKELSERINQVKSFNKLLNHQFNNHQNLSNNNIINKKTITPLNRSNRQTSNSIETTDDSINERSSCTNSQKSNSPNASLTPDLSNASKISPEHNNRSETNQIYLDDEYSDQPDLMFLNSKDNSTSNSPVKEDVNLVDNLINKNNENYRTNIRYSISELDSLKLKQELLMSSLKVDDGQSNNVDKLNSSIVSSSTEKSLASLSSPIRTKTFRKPRPLSYVESENGSLTLDNSSARSVMQDINGIKTLLFRLQGELLKSETQNPFENTFYTSQTNQNLMKSNGLDDNLSVDKCGFMNEDKNQNLELENQMLKKQLALFQQKMDEKDRTIKLLQQQMTKYLNINESNVTTKTSNAATQTERSDYRSLAPETKKEKDGIVVRSNDEAVDSN